MHIVTPVWGEKCVGMKDIEMHVQTVNYLQPNIFHAMPDTLAAVAWRDGRHNGAPGVLDRGRGRGDAHRYAREVLPNNLQHTELRVTMNSSELLSTASSAGIRWRSWNSKHAAVGFKAEQIYSRQQMLS